MSSSPSGRRRRDGNCMKLAPHGQYGRRGRSPTPRVGRVSKKENPNGVDQPSDPVTDPLTGPSDPPPEGP